tara:strand:- start:186 stop:827 length:642 start_codon:yes stop_codon:yes gene_type:complete
MSLPDFLIDKYKDWKKNFFLKEKELYIELEAKGQKPKAMIISCSDSRVDPNKIFNGKPGDYFVHRNVANLVPIYDSNKIENHEITSSIEYAVNSLKIQNIIILGHSSCGGIEYAYKRFSKENLENNQTSLDTWTKPIKTALKNIDKNLSDKIAIKSLEKMSVVNSLTNLKSYPKINELITKNKLTLHGLFFDISKGDISKYNDISDKFDIISY